MRAFHKQEMMTQKIYENILARRSGMYYSAGISFQTILVNMEKLKALTKNSQLGKKIRSKEDGSGVAPPSTYELTQIISLWGFLIERPKKGTCQWGYIYRRQRR